MVKFSKQLEVQLVPEWKSAFCNYWQLKKDIKEISLQRKRSSTNNPASFVRSFSRKRSDHWTHRDVILVHQRRSATQQEEIYETEPLEPISQAELEKLFFTRLDAQLNKVNQFYKGKEEEHFARMEVLIKQLHNLIEMRKILKERGRIISSSQLASGQSTELFQEDLTMSETEGISECSDANRRTTELEIDNDITMQLADTSGMTWLQCQNDEQRVERKIHTELWQHDISNSSEEFLGSAIPKRNQSRLNIPNVTPLLTISALSQMLWEDVMSQSKGCARSWRDDLNISRKKLHYAEKMLRTAFIEFYRGLGLLRSFSSLNMVAFVKILKKYDKVAGRQASLTYLKVVERAYFHSSDKVINMMDEIERVFTKHFANADHKKAMTFLRPIQQRASHTITFFLGIFTGCSLAFLAAFVILLHIFGLNINSKVSGAESNLYLNSVYPVFSMLALIILHMYMYGCNLYMWRRVRINYAFIFEFAPKNELRYREVLLVCTGLTTLLVGGMLAHVAARTKESSSPNIDIIPLALVLVFLLFLFFPLNVCYRSSRFFFLRSMKHIILSPLYKVVMADFFLADQLTSQVPMLKNTEYVMCYYFGAHFKRYHTDACTGNRFHYTEFAYVISLLPYWWRLMQCLRRWMDENDRAHIANGGKYLSAMMAAGARLTYLNRQSSAWLVIFIITSALSTIYQLYWDFVVDWGLLQPRSRNPWLRDQLILKRKYVYFISIGLDFFLRFAWLQSVTHLQFGKLDSQVTDFIFASLEVIRRGHWNFYRLENEHLNNVGKFRAVKSVPLPFRDLDESEV